MIPLKCKCSNCSKEFVKTDTRNASIAIHLFCSKLCHFEFLKTHKLQKEVECLTCNKKFMKKISECKKYPNHYCSHECISNRNKEKNIVYCCTCKQKLSRSPSLRYPTRKYIFCDKNCESKFKDTRKIVQCPYCKIEFKQSFNTQKFCSNSCKGNGLKNKIEVECLYCKQKVKRTPYQLKTSKYTFCSNSCKGKYYTWKNNRTRRSSSEVKLFEMIRSDFPTLEIHQNTRDILNCHLEIDIWIPIIKLAIELNGPCHFLNIYGDTVFKKTLTNDEIKKKEILERGFNLLIININQPDKIVKPLLIDQYQSVIKPMILSSNDIK